MQVQVEKLPKSEIKLTIEVPEERTKKLYEKAAKHVSEMVKVPGFRPGHVPLDVLKKHVKPDALESHMLDIALPETYSEAVKQEKLQVVSRPRIKIITSDPLKYEAVVAIYPEVAISGYDKIKIKEEEVKVDDKDVDKILEDIQKRHATFSEVDRAAKMGDKVELSFRGFDEGGAQLENTQSKNHPVILGEKTLVEGFEEQIVGMKKDDKKEFDIPFSKDYFHKPFQGKKVKFKVEVHKVEEIKLPELTPEFLKQILGEDKTLDEVKKNIKENLKHEKEHQEKVRRENEFLDKVAEMVKVEVPDSLIEEEIDGMMEEFKNQLEQKGISFQQYVEQTKKEVKDLREQRKPEAEKRLRLRFALHKIFEQEKIDATEADLKKEKEHILSLYPEEERKKVREEYKDGSYLIHRLENKIRIEKLFDTYLRK